MGFGVRSARASDIDSIVPWTTDTFNWGDYIPDRLPRWIASEDSEVLVSVDDEDTPRALAHVTMLSDHEAWLEGARVHPEYRRTGLGSSLNAASVAWATGRGARVIRLATEADNEPAILQVDGLGYRVVSRWIHAELPVGAHSCDERFRLHRAPVSDVEAAWLFWVASDLALAAREMIAFGWQWRRARPEDLSGAAGQGRLFQSPAGWIIVEEPEDDWMQTTWMATAPESLLGLLDGLLDLAARRGVTEVTTRMPNLPWITEAVSRLGGDSSEVLIYSKPV